VKAVQITAPGGREVLTYVDVPEPTPASGEVLISIEYAGVNFFDIYQRTGLYPAPMPLIPGCEAAGTIIGLGPAVREFRVGERVAWQGSAGAYAPRAAIAAAELIRLPDFIDTRAAAALLLQGLTAHFLAISTFPLAAGSTCLVHAAAGGVGLLLCQIASMRGARVIATVSTEDKAALARGAGADEIVLYTSRDFVTEVRRLTANRGVDVVYDSVGRATFAGSLSCLAPRGLMVLFGQSSGPVAPFDPQMLNQRGSLYLTRPTLANYVATRAELLERATQLFDWVRDGRLTIRIDRELALRDVAEAHRALESRETSGKILLRP
jgi:NADPH:quinone reductase